MGVAVDVVWRLAVAFSVGDDVLLLSLAVHEAGAEHLRRLLAGHFPAPAIQFSTTVAVIVVLIVQQRSLVM